MMDGAVIISQDHHTASADVHVALDGCPERSALSILGVLVARATNKKSLGSGVWLASLAMSPMLLGELLSLRVLRQIHRDETIPWNASAIEEPSEYTAARSHVNEPRRRVLRTLINQLDSLGSGMAKETCLTNAARWFSFRELPRPMYVLIITSNLS